jgi:hypothetical protein
LTSGSICGNWKDREQKLLVPNSQLYGNNGSTLKMAGDRKELYRTGLVKIEP